MLLVMLLLNVLKVNITAHIGLIKNIVGKGKESAIAAKDRRIAPHCYWNYRTNYDQTERSHCL
jgi:hypothetical protein